MQPGGIRPGGMGYGNTFSSNEKRQRSDASGEAADLLTDGSLSDEASVSRKRSRNEDSSLKADASIEEHTRLAQARLAQQAQQPAPPDTLMIMEDAAEELSQAASSSRGSQNKNLEQRRTQGLSRDQELELEGESELQAYLVETEADLTGLRPRIQKFLEDFEDDPLEARKKLEEETGGNDTEMGMFLQLALRFGQEGQRSSGEDEAEEDETFGLSQFPELQKAAAQFQFKDSETLDNLKEVYAQWKNESGHRTTMYAGFNVASDAHKQAISILRRQGVDDKDQLRSAISSIQRDYGDLVLRAVQSARSPDRKSDFQYHPDSVYLSQSQADDAGTKELSLLGMVKAVRNKFQASPIKEAIPNLVTMISHDITASKSSAENPVLQVLLSHASHLSALANMADATAEKVEQIQDVHPQIKIDPDALLYDIVEVTAQSFVMESSFTEMMNKHGTQLPSVTYSYDNPPPPGTDTIDDLKRDKTQLEVSMGFLRSVREVLVEIPDALIKREEKGREEMVRTVSGLQDTANEQEGIVMDMMLDLEEASTNPNFLH